MKSELIQFRAEGSLKRFLEGAATFDHKSLSDFIRHASILYAEQMRARGWNAKPAPQSRDGRRKVA